jgi:hypothetical protein
MARASAALFGFSVFASRISFKHIRHGALQERTLSIMGMPGYKKSLGDA